MSYSNDFDPGKRDCNAVDDTIAEAQAKIQGLEIQLARIQVMSLRCMKSVGFDLKCRRIVDGRHYLSVDVWTFLQFCVLGTAHCRARLLCYAHCKGDL